MIVSHHVFACCVGGVVLLSDVVRQEAVVSVYRRLFISYRTNCCSLNMQQQRLLPNVTLERHRLVCLSEDVSVCGERDATDTFRASMLRDVPLKTIGDSGGRLVPEMRAATLERPITSHRGAHSPPLRLMPCDCVQ